MTSPARADRLRGDEVSERDRARGTADPFRGTAVSFAGTAVSFGGTDVSFEGTAAPFEGTAVSFEGTAVSFGGTDAPFGGTDAPFGGTDAPFGGTAAPFGGTAAPFGGTGAPFEGTAAPFGGPGCPRWNRAGKSAKDRGEPPTRSLSCADPCCPPCFSTLSLAACKAGDLPISPEPAREAAPAPGGPDVNLPRPASGVLPPGAADKVLAVGAQPIVKVLDQGAEPRSDLSYALVKGTSQKMVMAMDMAVGVKTKGQTMPQTPMPRMTMTFDTSATDKNGAGEFRIDSHLIATSVDPSGGQQEQMARALRPQIDAMKGLGMAYWVSPKGRVHDVKLDMPPSVPAAAQQIMNGMSQSFESMVTPLPANPVGVGARWQVVSRLNTGGADILQSAIYTLKARAGNRATLDVTILQLAANDTIHTAQMPAGMSAKVRSFNSGGSGTTQVDLKSVAPESGTMSLRTGMNISVQGAGAGAGDDSTVDTTTTVQVSRP